jgi:hypothetical protein
VSVDATSTLQTAASTPCHHKDDECWSFRINDLQLFECGYSNNQVNAHLKANNLFSDSLCTISSVFNSCSGDDCNTPVDPLTCNIG